MQLIVSWDTFSKQFNEFKLELNDLLDQENKITTNAELGIIKESFATWKGRCDLFLKESFDSDKNMFTQSYFTIRLNTAPDPSNLMQAKKVLFTYYSGLRHELEKMMRILQISDIFVKPDIIKLTDRSKLLTEETLDLILDKLYDLYDDGKCHSIQLILFGNGVALKRNYEDRELGQILEENGYISIIPGRLNLAKLTLKGKMYIEDKRKVYKENYDNLKCSPDEINDKINEINQQLKKLGYGQEIIFDEINELKNLYTLLNHKNWGQVAKGKLIDLALAKLIENDTAKFIYEKLTDHDLRLP